MTDHDPENSDLFANARTDPVMRRYQKQMLEQLSKNTKNPVLAEMAQEMLAGNLTLRQAMATSAYAEALMTAGAATFAKHVAMSEEEKAAAMRDGLAALDQLDAQDEADQQQDAQAHQPGQRSSRTARVPEPEDDEPIGSLMISAGHPPAAPSAPSSVGQDEETPWTAVNRPPRSVRDRTKRS